MKALHEGDGAGNSRGGGNRVAKLRALLGLDVLLLWWPLGKKGSRRPWGHLTVAKMDEPAYLRKLETGNIGVAQGAKSNGLCSFDWDDDEFAERFVAANPALLGTLRSRGQRGCNLWVRCRGDYPGSFKIKTAAGDEVGEWRANGNQTIVSGQHPSGCAYSFVVEVPPLEVEFASIVWPEGLRPPPGMGRASPVQHSHTVPQPTQPLSHTVPQVVLAPACLVLDVERFLPSAEHENNGLLFQMARAVLDVERERGSQLTGPEVRSLFTEWHSRNRYTRPGFAFDNYWMEFQRALTNAKVPLSQTTLAVAIDAAKCQPMPPEAEEYTLPHIRLLVAICWQLQLATAPKPFFLTCREAGKAIETTPDKALRLLLSFCEPRSGFLTKCATGSLAGRRANEYRFRKVESV